VTVPSAVVAAIVAFVLMEPVTDAAGITFGRLRDTAGNHVGIYSPPSQ
jgi:hypothetical protein